MTEHKIIAVIGGSCKTDLVRAMARNNNVVIVDSEPDFKAMSKQLQCMAEEMFLAPPDNREGKRRTAIAPEAWRKNYKDPRLKR